MANDHQIYISSLDFSPKSQTHKFISTWIAFGHLKINRSKTELRILRPMLRENGNDHTNQFSSELSGFILDLCLSFTSHVQFANKSCCIISKAHPHFTTACHFHSCSLVQVLSSVAGVTTKAF